MGGDDRLIESLRAAVEAAPDDSALRLHLAELLLERGDRDEAVRRLGRVLQDDPGSRRALELLGRPAPARDDDVHWAGLEQELADVVPPMFVEGDSRSRRSTPTTSKASA